MKWKTTDLDDIQMDLIIRPDCPHCDRILQYFDMLNLDALKIHLRIFNLANQPELPAGRQSFVTPALWIDDELRFLGPISIPALKARLPRLPDIPIPISRVPAGEKI